MKGARAPFLAGCLLVVVFSLSGGLRFVFSGLTDGEGLTKSPLGLFFSRRFVKRIKVRPEAGPRLNINQPPGRALPLAQLAALRSPVGQGARSGCDL